MTRQLQQTFPLLVLQELDLNSTVWKTPEGRRRLNDWYDRFADRIESDVDSVEIPTRYGSSHVLIGGPVDGPQLICLHAMRTGAAFLLSELGPVLREFRVYAPDLPGQSIRGPDPFASKRQFSCLVAD
jgi:hypothetical protein